MKTVFFLIPLLPLLLTVLCSCAETEPPGNDYSTTGINAKRAAYHRHKLPRVPRH